MDQDGKKKTVGVTKRKERKKEKLVLNTSNKQ